MKPETGHDNCLGNKECKDIGEQHRKLCSVCNWGSTPEDHQTKATAGIKETKFFDASNKEVTKEADAAKKVTYYYCEPCGHYIGKDEETVQEVCDHYWHGTCGYTHTANTSVNLVHSTCSVRTNKSHCWSCNTTEFTYGSDETCTGCINGHSRAKFSCITCTHCGISQYAYQGTHKGTMWCAFHCQYIGAGSITAVNKNQNVTSGQKESVHWCEKWNNITNSHVTYYVKKDALGTYWGP